MLTGVYAFCWNLAHIWIFHQVLLFILKFLHIRHFCRSDFFVSTSLLSKTSINTLLKHSFSFSHLMECIILIKKPARRNYLWGLSCFLASSANFTPFKLRLLQEVIPHHRGWQIPTETSGVSVEGAAAALVPVQGVKKCLISGPVILLPLMCVWNPLETRHRCFSRSITNAPQTAVLAFGVSPSKPRGFYLHHVEMELHSGGGVGRLRELCCQGGLKPF